MSQVVRVMIVDVAQRRYRLRTLVPGQVQHDPRDDYTILGGEALCQFILREDPGALVIARGPLPFLAGNKTTVGYISPLTGLPHYSFVGGRGFAALFNLGLDALVSDVHRCRKRWFCRWIATSSSRARAASRRDVEICR